MQLEAEIEANAYEESSQRTGSIDQTSNNTSKSSSGDRAISQTKKRKASKTKEDSDVSIAEQVSDYEDKRAKRAAKRRNNEKVIQTSETAGQPKNCCWTEEAKQLYI